MNKYIFIKRWGERTRGGSKLGSTDPWRKLIWANINFGERMKDERTIIPLPTLHNLSSHLKQFSRTPVDLPQLVLRKPCTNKTKNINQKTKCQLGEAQDLRMIPHIYWQIFYKRF